MQTLKKIKLHSIMKMQSILKPLAFTLIILCNEPILAALTPARLLYNDGTHDDVLVISYSAGTATYRSSANSLNILRVSKPKLESVYFYKPQVFSEAMSLYYARNYAEAKVKFAECEVTFKSLDSLPDNYASLAGFYKMECSRRMFDLEALSSELEQYRKKGLTRENHLQQLEIYTFWEAVRLKDWERLDRLALSWQGRKLPAGLRVQIEYCHALALDKLAQPKNDQEEQDPELASKALGAYSRAMCANAASSIEIVLEATNNAMRLYANDKGVQRAMSLWKTVDENTSSPGYRRLIEANSLVKYYQQVGFDQMKPLASEYKKFLEYSGPKAEAASIAPSQGEDEADGEAADPASEQNQEAEEPETDAGEASEESEEAAAEGGEEAAAEGGEEAAAEEE